MSSNLGYFRWRLTTLLELEWTLLPGNFQLAGNSGKDGDSPEGHNRPSASNRVVEGLYLPISTGLETKGSRT